MRKIPTIFDRDWDGNRQVVAKPNPAAEWVFAGEGVPTRKLDGTSVMVREGRRFRRRELRAGEKQPDDFEVASVDDETGKTVGWVPVGDGPADRYPREAAGGGEDGTYELVGPKVQGNPERYETHELVRHGAEVFDPAPPTDHAGLRAWLDGRDVEGVVWHHPDGRMAKIKLRDFGLKRPTT